MTMSRREMLRHSAATGAAVAVAGGLAQLYLPGIAVAAPAGGYGALVPDPAGYLDLPNGFSYTIVSRTTVWNTWTSPVAGTPGLHAEDAGKPIAPGASSATPYSDSIARYGTLYYKGNNTDGTGSFAGPNGGTTLVQNSELNGALTATNGGVPQSGVPTYDPGHRGGTSTSVLDANGNLVLLVASIAGTYSNGAGGVTPWNTWLTCEETEASNGTILHGYVFEVDPQDALLAVGTPVANLKTMAIPLTAIGRFAHEAVAVDPATNVAYLTEDAGASVLAGSSTGYSNNGLFYKFVPTNAAGGYGSYQAGATLYAMKAGNLINLA